jgi:hypothetical protein
MLLILVPSWNHQQSGINLVVKNPISSINDLYPQVVLMKYSQLTKMDTSTSYYASDGVDKIANYYLFEDLKEGVFVDVGAEYPKIGSVSYFYEQTLHWRGVCVEPNEDRQKDIEDSRTCSLYKVSFYYISPANAI